MMHLKIKTDFVQLWKFDINIINLTEKVWKLFSANKIDEIVCIRKSLEKILEGFNKCPCIDGFWCHRQSYVYIHIKNLVDLCYEMVYHLNNKEDSNGTCQNNE